MQKLLVLASLALLDACGGGGSRSSVTAASPSVDVTGRWLGPWHSTRGPGGTFELSVTQIAGDVAGDGVVAGSPCFGEGSVHGFVSGSTFRGTLKEPLFVLRFNAIVSADEESMTGTYVTTGGPCTGDTGTIALERQ